MQSGLIRIKVTLSRLTELVSTSFFKNYLVFPQLKNDVATCDKSTKCFQTSQILQETLQVQNSFACHSTAVTQTADLEKCCSLINQCQLWVTEEKEYVSDWKCIPWPSMICHYPPHFFSCRNILQRRFFFFLAKAFSGNDTKN